jgi:hypothetical protein
VHGHEVCILLQQPMYDRDYDDGADDEDLSDQARSPPPSSFPLLLGVPAVLGCGSCGTAYSRYTSSNVMSIMIAIQNYAKCSGMEISLQGI